MDAEELRYLKLLSESFPTIADASAEIINLRAILNLPKGTELVRLGISTANTMRSRTFCATGRDRSA